MRGRGPLRRGPIRKPPVVALALLIPLLAGCELLFPGFAQGPEPSGLGEFPGPSPIATFGSGHATIAIEGGDTIRLDELHGDGELTPFVGASISWENESGWYLRLIGGGGAGAVEEFPANLTIDRIVEDEHWTTGDLDRCVVDIDKADKTGVKGSATCKGLQWHDALAAYNIALGQQDLIPDQPKFDATITFEAAPTNGG